MGLNLDVFDKKEAVEATKAISEGAVNILAISNALVKICRYERANGKDDHYSPLVAIVVDQLKHLTRRVDMFDAYNQLDKMVEELKK